MMNASDQVPSLPNQTAFTPGRYIAMTPSPAARIPVLSSPTGRVALIAQLPGGCEVEVIAASGPWAIVRLPNARQGYVAAASLRPAPRDEVLAEGSQRFALSQSPLPASRSPRPELATGRSGGMLGISSLMMLGLLSAFAIVGGGMLLATAQVQCPYPINGGPVDPYSTSCTVLAYPFLGLGAILLSAGLVGLVASLVVARAHQRRFK